jgi:hypothetical protein
MECFHGRLDYRFNAPVQKLYKHTLQIKESPDMPGNSSGTGEGKNPARPSLVDTRHKSAHRSTFYQLLRLSNGDRHTVTSLIFRISLEREKSNI